MRKYINIFIILLVIVGIFYFASRKEVVAPVMTNEEPTELCFVKFGIKDQNGFYDKFTLRLKMEREKAIGELRLLPAEKDALVGKFAGTVGAVDKVAMTRTANLIWDTEGEGMTAKQELRIIFGEGMASVGFGEMTLREDGVYAYQGSVDYSFSLNDYSCKDLSERESVEKYLWGNIITLSPVKAVLGGTWYVVSMDLDLEKDSGTVTYEDGHVQEKRNFTYTMDEKNEVASMVIN